MKNIIAVIALTLLLACEDKPSDQQLYGLRLNSDGDTLYYRDSIGWFRSDYHDSIGSFSSDTIRPGDTSWSDFKNEFQNGISSPIRMIIVDSLHHLIDK